MAMDVACVCNALMDALVLVDHTDALLDELGLVRGIMHPVDHDAWQRIHDRVADHGVALESGGSGANTIATLGRLGARAIFCGQVGDDPLGHTYAARITDACGAHALRFAPDTYTGKCLSIVAREDAERTMCTDLGASTGLGELGDFLDTIRSAKVLHITGYTMLGGPIKDAVEAALIAAEESGVLVSIDVADPFVVHAIKPYLWERIVRHADVLFLNAEEARALTGDEPEHAAEQIARDAGVRTVVVKLGHRGSVVLHDGVRHEIGIERVAAIDTTGAGDAYAGGFLYGMTQGWSPDRSGALAAAVAAATVSQLGAVVNDAARLRALVERFAPRAA